MFGLKLKSKTVYTALFIGIGLLLALFAGCGGGSTRREGQPANAQPAASPAVVQAQIAVATAREVANFINTTGSLIANEQSDVAPEVAGQIVATPVNIGDFVRQGDVIARLDNRDARLRLEQAQAGVQQAETALQQSRTRLGLREGQRFDPNQVAEVQAARQQAQAASAQVANLEAQIANAEAQARLAEDTARRYANLLRTGDTSRLVYNQQQTQAEAARAQVNATRAQLNGVRAQANAAQQQLQIAINTATGNNQGIASAQANLENSRAAVGLAQQALNNTIVRAPFAGSISDRPIAVGEFVTTASRIATIVRTNPIKVNLQLPEADAGQVRVGQAVSINVAAFADRQFAGSITAINPVLDPAARSIIVEAQIDNSENLLRPNMFATARILQERGNMSVFVPRSAVMNDSTTNTSSVFVVEGDTARQRPVEIGIEENGDIQIITGVNQGERVVTGNLQQLYDGARVQG